MTNPNLLTDSLASTMASEVVYSACEEEAYEAMLENLTSTVKESVVKSTLQLLQGAVAELKRTAYFETLFKALLPHEKKFSDMLKRIWAEEERIIVANIKKMKKSWLDKAKDPVDSMLYPKGDFEAKIINGSNPLYISILSKQGQVELDRLKVDVVFDVTNPEVEKWLNKYTPVFSKNLEEISIAKLRAELITGMEAGEGIPDLIKRVNETYAHWNKVRSETIARSEASRAANRAALEAYKQSGVVKKKIWVTSPGACGFCAPLDGKIVALEKTFFDKGDSTSAMIDGKKRTMRLDYENVESPPLHPRCRCAISAWIEE